jgi:hypothetical protein|tara:strand:- start:755 stop:982 length:228 start_codon:yes stop_codon:yes gene_type:complete
MLHKNELFQISPQKTLLNLKQFCFRGKTHVSDWHMAVIYCRTRKRECRIYSAFLQAMAVHATVYLGHGTTAGDIK